MADDNEDRGDGFTPPAEGDENADLEAKNQQDDAQDTQDGGGGDDTQDGGGDDSQEGGAEDTVDGGSKKDKIYIPKERFDAAVGKARKEAEAARREAEALKAAEKARQGQIDSKKIEAEIDDLEDRLDGARADGNKDEARRIRAEIRQKQNALVDARADVKAAYATAQAVEQVRWDNTVERMEKEHPELDPSEDNEAYDQEKVDEIMDLTEAFVAKGESSTEALKKAIRVTYRGAPAPEKDAGAEAAKKKAAEEAAAKRREEAVAKARAASKDAPAAPGKGGKNSDAAGKKTTVTDINKITDEQMDKLPPAELARMRGDIV